MWAAVVIGPDARSNQLLELGVVYDDEDTIVVHAMPARAAWRNRSTARRPLPLHLLGATSWQLAAWFESDAAVAYFLDDL